MGRTTLALLASVTALALLPALAAAQDSPPTMGDDEERAPRVDLSVSAGGVIPTSWSGIVLLGSISSASGVFEQVLTRDLRVESNTGFKAAVTYWRGRYGFRTQAAFSRSSLRVGAVPAGAAPAIGLTDAGSTAVDTWLYGVGGALGLLDYEAGRRVWPYAFFGFGGVTYRLDNPIAPPLTFVGSTPPQPGSSANTIVVENGGQQFVLGVNALSTETEFAFNFGLGTDFRIPLGAAGVGLRLEVADHVSASPVQVNIQSLSGPSAFVADSAVHFPTVHQLSATAGVVVHIGR